MFKIKNENGLTMITLVITIIVMLIIIGVVVQTLVDTKLIDRAKGIDYKAEFAELSEEWNTRRAELQMKGVVDADMNYPDLKTATIQVGETTLQEKLIRATKLSDDMNDKIQVKNGRLVYSKDACTAEEIEYFKGEGLKEISEVE